MFRATESRGGKSIIIWAMMVSIIVMSWNVGSAQATDDNVVTRSLQGTIVDEAGVPIEGATLQIGIYNASQGFRFVGSGSTDTQGKYSIDYEKTLGDAVSAILKVRGFVVVYEVLADTLDVELPEESSTITGTITFGDEYATPVGNYPVNLGVYLGRGEGRINIGDALTDADGRYVFSFIPGNFNSMRGENYFVITYNGNQEETLQLHQGGHAVRDRTVYDQPPSYFNGRLEADVTDAATNEPIEDAVVELVGTNIPLVQSGHYFFSNVLRGGPYTVRASAPGYETTEEPIEINGFVYRLSVKMTASSVGNPPVVTAVAEREPDRNGWYNRDVLVSFHAADEEGEVTVDPPVLVTAEGSSQTITGTATNAAGLTGTGSIIISLDKSAPSTDALTSGDTSGGQWFRSDVEVSLSAIDSLSGVEGTEYSLNHGRTWKAYQGPITFTNEGEHRLQYRSTDLAGNKEAIKQLVVKIDRTPPVLLVVSNPPLLTNANGRMAPVRTVVMGADFYSGVESIELTSIKIHENGGNGTLPTPDDIQKAEYGTFDTSFELRAEAPAPGLTRHYTITYTATDRAGNETTAKTVVSVAKLWSLPWQ